MSSERSKDGKNGRGRTDSRDRGRKKSEERYRHDSRDRGIRRHNDRDSRERENTRNDRRRDSRERHDKHRRQRSSRSRSRSRDINSRDKSQNLMRNESSGDKDLNRDRQNVSSSNSEKKSNQSSSLALNREPRWGKEEEYNEPNQNDVEPKAEEPKFKPNFGLSGALAKDEKTGNMVNGVVLKFTEPFEAAKPDKNWRFYVYRGEELVETLHIHRRSCFLIGRDDRVADIPTLHPTCSLQHAVIQFRSIEKKEIHDGERITVTYIKPYIMDLQSTHGTFLNGTRIEDSRYYELLEGDVLKFGGSSREYVLLHDKSGKDD